MVFIKDALVWAGVFILVLSGAARAAFDGAFFAYFRPQWEALVDNLPDVVKWFL